MDRKEGGNATISMGADNNQGYLKQLSLAYYANQLTVYFQTESMIAHAINLLAGADQDIYHNVAVPMDKVVSTAMEIY